MVTETSISLSKDALQKATQELVAAGWLVENSGSFERAPNPNREQRTRANQILADMVESTGAQRPASKNLDNDFKNDFVQQLNQASAAEPQGMVSIRSPQKPEGQDIDSPFSAFDKRLMDDAVNSPTVDKAPKPKQPKQKVTPAPTVEVKKEEPKPEPVVIPVEPVVVSVKPEPTPVATAYKPKPNTSNRRARLADKKTAEQNEKKAAAAEKAAAEKKNPPPKRDVNPSYLVSDPAPAPAPKPAPVAAVANGTFSELTIGELRGQMVDMNALPSNGATPQMSPAQEQQMRQFMKKLMVDMNHPDIKRNNAHRAGRGQNGHYDAFKVDPRHLRQFQRQLMDTLQSDADANLHLSLPVNGKELSASVAPAPLQEAAQERQNIRTANANKELKKKRELERLPEIRHEMMKLGLVLKNEDGTYGPGFETNDKKLRGQRRHLLLSEMARVGHPGIRTDKNGNATASDSDFSEFEKDYVESIRAGTPYTVPQKKPAENKVAPVASTPEPIVLGGIEVAPPAPAPEIKVEPKADQSPAKVDELNDEMKAKIAQVLSTLHNSAQQKSENNSKTPVADSNRLDGVGSFFDQDFSSMGITPPVADGQKPAGQTIAPENKGTPATPPAGSSQDADVDSEIKVVDRSEEFRQRKAAHDKKNNGSTPQKPSAPQPKSYKGLMGVVQSNFKKIKNKAAILGIGILVSVSTLAAIVNKNHKTHDVKKPDAPAVTESSTAALPKTDNITLSTTPVDSAAVQIVDTKASVPDKAPAPKVEKTTVVVADTPKADAKATVQNTPAAKTTVSTPAPANNTHETVVAKADVSKPSLAKAGLGAKDAATGDAIVIKTPRVQYEQSTSFAASGNTISTMQDNSQSITVQADSTVEEKQLTIDAKSMKSHAETKQISVSSDFKNKPQVAKQMSINLEDMTPRFQKISKKLDHAKKGTHKYERLQKRLVSEYNKRPPMT